MEPHWWRYLILPTLLAVARPCRREDVHYDFTECHQGPALDGGPVREAFAYVDRESCNLRDNHSVRLPPPLLDLPCEQPCGANRFLQLKEDHQASRLKVNCIPCPRGRFSLGGGLYVDGSTSDWSRPWPAGLTTSCLYRSSDARWVLGGSARLTCVLHVGSLRLETRAGTWNQNLPDQLLEAPLQLVDTSACEAISGSSNLAGTVALVLRGSCAFSTKTEHLAAVGVKAVIVYNNLYQRPHFYPAAANGSMPSIPIFMVTREDGERIIAEAAETAETLFVQIPSSRCSLDQREVAPASNSSRAAAPSSTPAPGGSSGKASSWEATEKSCAEWKMDPTGAFVHSGENQGFHWLYSFLTLSVRFVRDGYVRFRYAVDAEDGYDGLLFEMDGEVAWNSTMSQVAPWREFRWEVPKGAHSFTWTYKKDFSGSSGEDRAKLQLLEVSGTGHADSECRSCTLLSSPGSQRCLSCGRNEYAALDQPGRVHCVHCPANTWAPAGSASPESCKPRRRCTPQDVELVYRAPQGKTGAWCQGNRTSLRGFWRSPKVCAGDSSPLQVALQTEVTQAKVQKPCPPCQPFQYRPNGKQCVPRPAVTCREPQTAMPALEIVHWHRWPQNFTSWVWGRSPAEDHPHAWQRTADGRSAVVGSSFLGEEVESYTDQALLMFDVDLVGPGELFFTLEEKPSGAWQRRGGLYVNHEPREAQLVGTVNGRASMKMSLPSGWHWITWVWRYHGPVSEESSSDAWVPPDELMGVKLWNVTVTNVRGAPRGRCRACPANHGRYNGSSTCQLCPPGTEESSGRCRPCGANTANARAGGRCMPCGPGTKVGGQGLVCKAKAKLGGDGQLSWDVRRLLDSWKNISGREGFHRISVEDRVYYLNLLRPMELQGASSEFLHQKAYAWEALPPRTEEEAEDQTCTASAFVRPLVDLLEAVKPNEGMPAGLWFTFLGPCMKNGEPSHRRLHFLLSCHPDAAPEDFRMLSSMHPPSVEGCEPVALEWRSRHSCPVCQPGDWEALAPTQCDPIRGQKVSFVAPSGCQGGAQRPKEYWEPCPGVLNLMALVLVGALVGCVLCCLSIYVLLLRRRYAKYMTLEEHPSAPEPSSIGVPTTPDFA
ncbi:Endosome/lysosome-associated apoptosis and autophagy regulator 1 [Durusdinium trenchii]